MVERGTDVDVGFVPRGWKLRELFVTFETRWGAEANIDEYSDTNIRFHQSIIALSNSELLKSMSDTLFVRMRAIRVQIITERDRVSRSIIDHVHIIEAIEKRNAALAERLVREHCFGLAEHINDYVDYLDLNRVRFCVNKAEKPVVQVVRQESRKPNERLFR